MNPDTVSTSGGVGGRALRGALLPDFRPAPPIRAWSGSDTILQSSDPRRAGTGVWERVTLSIIDCAAAIHADYDCSGKCGCSHRWGTEPNPNNQR